MENKIKMESKDNIGENIKKIKEIFPNIITETEEGEKIDYEKLKQELSGEIIEGSKEKYELTWPGKKEAIVNANKATRKTLRPVESKSSNFGETKNIYIEGDNLEALKILQESYLNKIKCIYIDPPYNTGNDLIYNDNFNKELEEEKKDTGDVDEEGSVLLVSNNGYAGRFHSKWLSMMYSRLKIARNLLSKDGLIFISIDDNELFNLKKICDEIYGERNFVNCISIKMSELSGVKMKHLKKYPKLKESLLIYSKDNEFAKLVIEKHKKSEKDLSNYLKYYSNVILNKEDDVTKWEIIPITEYLKINNINIPEREINNWKIEHADIMVYRTNSRTITKYIKEHPEAPEICSLKNEDNNEIIKWEDKEMLFLNKYIEEYLGDIWMDISTINLNKETDIEIFENGQKPIALIKRIIKSVYKNEDAIILDFFSGSATTAHATMLLNVEDNANRKFIMIQIPEKINNKTKKLDDEIQTLCDIGEERIRRAGQKIKKTNKNVDCGFRVFKIDSSNMKNVYYEPSTLVQEKLNMFKSNIKEDRTAEDLLIQVILNLGLTLDLKIEKKKFLNNNIFFVDDNYLVACFDEKIDTKIVEQICEEKPSKIVFREESFNNDSEKINIYEKIKELSPKTDINVI